MNKKLLKICIWSIAVSFILINVLPNVFSSINNSGISVISKATIAFAGNKDDSVNINANKGNVIIMLDDGWKTQYTVGYNYMYKKNMRGSIAVIPSLVGTYGYMNKGDLYDLYDNNWDIINHTYSHLLLSENSLDIQISEISKADKWLSRNGFISSNKVLIYPEGEYNSDTIKAMKQLNYISGRTTNDGYNSKKPTNLYNIKVKNVFSDIKPNEVYNWINYAINNNVTVILLFHRLENDIDKTLMKYKKEDFYKIINYIDQRRDDLNIITYLDWIKSITGNVAKI